MSIRVPDWLAVFVGGVVGTAARAGLDVVAKASPVRGLFLSWSTLTVNAVGAFLLGALAAWVASWGRLRAPAWKRWGRPLLCAAFSCRGRR